MVKEITSAVTRYQNFRPTRRLPCRQCILQMGFGPDIPDAFGAASYVRSIDVPVGSCIGDFVMSTRPELAKYILGGATRLTDFFCCAFYLCPIGPSMRRFALVSASSKRANRWRPNKWCEAFIASNQSLGRSRHPPSHMTHHALYSAFISLCCVAAAAFVKTAFKV